MSGVAVATRKVYGHCEVDLAATCDVVQKAVDWCDLTR